MCKSSCKCEQIIYLDNEDNFVHFRIISRIARIALVMKEKLKKTKFLQSFNKCENPFNMQFAIVPHS